MRVLLDYTSALNQRGGVGRYTRSLTAALQRCRYPDVEIALWSARRSVPSSACTSDGAGEPRVRVLPVPERWMTVGWQRLRIPLPVDWVAGGADVIHAPDFVAPPHRAPAVVTVHDLSYLVTPDYAYPNLRRYLSAAVPRSLKRAAGIVAVSRSTADDLSEFYGIDPSRITVVHNGVDPAFRPAPDDAIHRALAQLELRQPYFVIVGTIEPRKNHLGLLRAFEALSATRPDASLVIVGRPGWMSEGIMAEIDAVMRRLPVRHLPDIEDSLLPALYTGSVALVYPSWYEGFGLPVVEAMACGTAVITSDRGSLAEVAGDAALLVPPDSPEAIADAMRMLLDDPVRRRDLVESGLRRARRFTWEAAALSHLNLYRSVAATGG